MLNSFSFCLSGKLLISLSILSDNIAGLSILGCVFSFSILNIFCPLLLACKVSAERSASSLMGISLFVTSCFSLAPFKREAVLNLD